MNNRGSSTAQKTPMQRRPYRNLLIMTPVSFVAMYVLMYPMVNTLSNVYNNLDEVYMAGLMVAPMPIISLIVMGKMFSNSGLNAAILAVSIIAGLVFFGLIRVQGGVGDRQFLRSMIPHHSSAILMCQQASIQDAETKDLCQEIISSQQSEIDQMKAILKRMNQ